ELRQDRGDADLVLTGVVEQVRRGPAAELRLQLGGDLGGRLHVEGDAVILLRRLLGGERDVVGAVAAVEDDRVDGRSGLHAERVVGVAAGAGIARPAGAGIARPTGAGVPGPAGAGIARPAGA